MPDATIVVEKVWKSDPKEGDYGTYFKYDVQYAGGGKARYVTFKDELGEKATASIGRKVLVTFEAPTQEGRNPKITAISDPLDDTVAPTASANGSGNTKMADAPETRAAIAASVALDKAVLRANGDSAEEDVLGLADEYYAWLMEKSAGAVPEPEKPAQSVEEPSEEQRRRLAEILEKLNTQAPKQEGQKSWTEDLAYFAEHTLGKTTGLSSSEYEQLIDQAEWFVKDQALSF